MTEAYSSKKLLHYFLASFSKVSYSFLVFFPMIHDSQPDGSIQKKININGSFFYLLSNLDVWRDKLPCESLSAYEEGGLHYAPGTNDYSRKLSRYSFAQADTRADKHTLILYACIWGYKLTKGICTTWKHQMFWYCYGKDDMVKMLLDVYTLWILLVTVWVMCLVSQIECVFNWLGTIGEWVTEYVQW